MSIRSNRKSKSITTKAAELAVLMVAEKKIAFAEAWQAMATQMHPRAR